MTEPPQPPNQPPTPSGYGHLPGPPQPGYGFPPQGANPYAQQPPTVPQQQAHPGYGYPPPMPPGPPPGGPAGPDGQRRQKLLIVIAASVAGVLILGTGAWFAFGKGDDEAGKPVAQASTPADAKPSASASVDKGDGSGNGGGDQEDLNAGRKQGEDKVLWLKSSKVDGPGAGVDSEGQWIVGDTVVKSVWKSLTAFAVADGKEKWTLSFPTELCGVTPDTTADGKTVVMFKDGESDSSTCNQMRLVDLKTGKAGWTKEVPKEGLFDIMTSPTLSITGDTVGVSRSTTASAFKVSTGDKLFGSAQAEGCKPGSYIAGNNKMIAIATCYDDDHTVEVHDVDPVTGKSTWNYRLAKNHEVTSVYSLDPLVLDISDKDKKERGIVVVGPDGKQRTGVSGEGSFANKCGGGLFGSIQVCRGAVVDSNTLYLPTTPAAGTGNEVVAFDLGTGKVKWRAPAGDKRTLTPVTAVNGQLVAYRAAEQDKGGEILTYPAGGGEPAATLRNPSGPASAVENSFYKPRIDYVDGRLYISVTHLLAKGKDEKLLMVFGK
ncbi:outer membrane protein assembly factor BamB family protein [Streptomyces sp. NPDC054949]|uniref:outer membrane protein assembly factor BamB family protein n=1 Tax=unclassified Streptomyces TaxID=2593676 RepID=UPI002256FB4F|nr:MULTISPECIES: PQQ-binding-like beta-propeller repeat protein [unclassified Streptomyces]MCX5074992.1 PQQ-binding-like beta-propeller repeat protein [Streptomyces sp. NBC_00424]MCX5153390.1 PQQ-binding-like beta-propeller repeat protein [Streptomyces sp. NBC_00291]WUD41855.1 PQQ-binding-like beta-propeller repeat protein [Streptomyces sp. NBC_00513]